MNEQDNPIVQVIDEAMSKLKTIVDIDTVMGEPVAMPDGSSIIPITKITMGFVAGGGEYSTDSKRNPNFPFSGGSGAGFAIKPIGFLVGKNNNYEWISIADEPAYKKLASIVADLAKTYIKQKVEGDKTQKEGNDEDKK